MLAARGDGQRALYFCQPVEIGAQNRALEGEIHELAGAAALDEAGLLELLQMMREGGGADLVRPVQRRARQHPVGLADLLQDLVAPRLGQRPGDGGELTVGELDGFLGGHGADYMVRARPGIESALNPGPHPRRPAADARSSPRWTGYSGWAPGNRRCRRADGCCADRCPPPGPWRPRPRRDRRARKAGR